jgi:SAM-dependent methyltransferase
MEEKDFLWLNLRELPYFRAMLRAVEAQFYQEFTLDTPIVDLGCGDGHFARITFNHKIDVGIDPWSAPIHQAAQGGAYRWLTQADGGKMPFPDAYFASAISNSVLEHIGPIEAVLTELRRVLRPGAQFIFCVPNPRYLSELSIAGLFSRMGFKGARDAYTRWFKRMSRVEHAVWPETWQAWLEKAGFHLERWWHYFSPQAMRMLEWGHFFGAPTLLPHAIYKRWIIAPYHWNLFLTERMVKSHTSAQPDPLGTFTFYITRSV